MQIIAVWTGLSIAIVVAAIIGALIRRRLILPAMLAWVASPLLTSLGMDLWEAVVWPGRYPPGTVFYGFMLVSPILALPWLVLCLTGFGLGFGMRLLLRRRRSQQSALRSKPSNAAVTKPISVQDALMPTETPGWRSIHIGFEQDGLTISGLDVWRQEWLQAGEASVRLPHPAYPNQMHRYTTFTIGSAADPVRFAACEVSNGVWGFSIPLDDQVQAQGASQDGKLRYEHRFRLRDDGRSDSVYFPAVLIDAASEKVLIDCTGWLFSRIVPNADGSLFLRLQQNSFDFLFRIDPTGRQFWDHGESGAKRPLFDLAVAVEQARNSIGQAKDQVAYRYISPDASIRVDLSTAEWSNTHWVNSPRVVDLARGKNLLDLWGTDWDAAVSFFQPRRVSLSLRRYRSGSNLTLEIDLKRDIYQILLPTGSGGAMPEAPLANIASALETATTPVASVQTLSRRAATHPRAAWQVALLITVMAVVVIAGATILVAKSAQIGGSAPPPLATVPRFNAPPPR